MLAEHDGRFNKDEARSMLRKEFTERLDRIDITLVLNTLMDDYGLIAPIGEAWIRLTPEGETMARRGMKNYQRKLSIKEQFKVAGKVITEIYYKLLNMKRILFLIITFSLATSITWAQEEASVPPKSETNIFANPYKRTPSIVKDKISSDGVRFIWGNYVYANVDDKDKTKNLRVNVFATQVDSIINFNLCLGIHSADVKIHVSKDSPILIKFSDDSIAQTKAINNANDVGTVSSIMNHVYTSYDIFVYVPLDSEMIQNIQKGLKKFRLEVNDDIYDLVLKKDNLSKFIIDEYILIRNALKKKRNFADDF